MKLNKKEIKTIQSVEPVLLAIADLKAQLAFYEAKRSAIESQLQGIDKRKFVQGNIWHGGVQVYTFARETLAYKKIVLELLELLADLGVDVIDEFGDLQIPEKIKDRHTKRFNSIKTKLAGV